MTKEHYCKWKKRSRVWFTVNIIITMISPTYMNFVPPQNSRIAVFWPWDFCYRKVRKRILFGMLHVVMLLVVVPGSWSSGDLSEGKRFHSHFGCCIADCLTALAEARWAKECLCLSWPHGTKRLLAWIYTCLSVDCHGLCGALAQPGCAQLFSKGIWSSSNPHQLPQSQSQ